MLGFEHALRCFVSPVQPLSPSSQLPTQVSHGPKPSRKSACVPGRERAWRVSHANGASRRSGERERVSGSPRGGAPRISLGWSPRPCHTPYGLRNLALVQPREAQTGERARLPVERVPAARVPGHPALDTAAGPCLDVNVAPQVHPQRHAAGCDGEVDIVAKRPTQAPRQHLATRRVDAADPRDVALQLAVLEQLGDRAPRSPDRPGDRASAGSRRRCRAAARGATTKPMRSPGARIFESVPT